MAAEPLDRAGSAAWVLVVDDEPTIAVTLRDDLEEQGYHVVIAADGVQALQRLGEGPFAAVVTDLRLPGADGARVVREARARSAVVGILVISANLDGQRERLRTEGADDFLQKPFGNDEVLAWLRGRRSARHSA